MNNIPSYFNSISKGKFLSYLLLFSLMIFLIAIYFPRAKWGLPYQYYWDEPQIASTALDMLKTGDFNPHVFDYGSFPIYVNYFVDVFHFFYLMGKPEGATSFISNLGEILTFRDTGYYWEISHPSFYYWNRLVVVLMSLGTIFLMYKTSKNISNSKYLGLLSAIFLGITPLFVTYSALITPNSFILFFALAVCYCSIKFYDSNKKKYLTLAAIFSGLAIASKYNSGLFILIPIIFLIAKYIENKNKIYLKEILRVFFISIIVFFLSTPFAFIDSVHFLNEAAGQLRHYKVIGHPGATIKPGFIHMKYQLMQFKDNLGIVALFVISLGFFQVRKNIKLLLLTCLGALYFLYMINTKVNFHRNLLLIYPFLALLYIFGLDLIRMKINEFAKNNKLHKNLIGGFVFSLVIFVTLLPNIRIAYSESRTISTPDTRSSMIYEIQKIENIKNVIVASELRVHNQDLRKIGLPFEVASIKDIDNCKKFSENTLFILPASIKNLSVDNNLQNLNQILLKLVGIGNVVASYGIQGNYINIDTPTANPEVLFIKIARLKNCSF